MNKVKHYLLIICLLYTSNIFAKFGASCSLLINGPSDDYLYSSTAYGHLSGNIEMVDNIDDACDKTTSEIKFCLKMPKETARACSDPIIMRLGETKAIRDFAGTSLLARDTNLQDIKLSVQRVADSVCLTMPTSRGIISLGCKTITATSPSLDTSSGVSSGSVEEEVCSNVASSCHSGNTNSQSILNFSGMTVDCLQETLYQVFFDRESCTSTMENPNSSTALLAPFPIFMYHMREVVQWFIILYVMMFAANMALSPNSINSSEIFTFIFKVFLVTYFAIGFYGSSVNGPKESGMIKYVVPILPEVTASFANMVVNAGGARGLCEFDTSRYANGKEFYALWDAIDCRLGYYLGMGVLYNDAPPSTPSKGNNDSVLSSLKDIMLMKIFPVLFGLLMSSSVSGILAFVAGLAFAIMFISIILGFLTSYLGSLVTLYAMAYISPIFIPMVLFARTKAYFDSWLKIVISCILQPAVRMGFIALLVDFYDKALYKNCIFVRHDYDVNSIKYSTFEIKEPISDQAECLNSAGYQLLKYYQGIGWTPKKLMFFSVDTITSVSGLLEGLIFAAVFSYIAYFFVQTLNKFAADLTSGPVMDAISASPTQIIDAALKAAEFAKNVGSSAGGGGGGGAGKEAEKLDPTKEIADAQNSGGNTGRKDDLGGLAGGGEKGGEGGSGGEKGGGEKGGSMPSGGGGGGGAAGGGIPGGK